MTPRLLSIVALFSLAALPASGAPDTPAPPPPTGAAARPFDAEVRALLDRWLAAQNEGRFDDYGALYATAFEGVRRSGEKTRTFDRKGWLADRKRMFRDPMTVTATEVAIEPAGVRTVLRFTQTWSSKGYSDRGPKEMVLTREDGTLRIAREEMLRSDLAKEQRGHGDGQFAFVVHADAPYVVLAGAFEDEWLAGRPETLAPYGPATARRALRPAAGPAELRAWKGRTLALYDGTHEVCRATVGDLWAMVRAEPHFGMVESWKELRASKAAVELWELGRAEGSVLVAKLAPEAGAACKGALWARDASLPAPRLWAPHEDATLAGSARAAFRKLPGYAKLTREWKEQPEPPTEPLDLGETSGAFRDAEGSRTLVAVWGHRNDGCGVFYGQLSGVWEPGSAGTGLRLVTGGETEARQLLGVFDLDGDGSPELLFRSFDYQETQRLESVTLPRFLDAPYYDCPC